MKRVIIGAALLAGCAPVIQSASPDSVSVMYEAPQMNAASTASTAQYACGHYGKKAVFVSDVHSAPSVKIADNLGQRIATWKCE